MTYQVEIKTGPKTWKKLRNGYALTLDAAQQIAASIDEDRCLINVRVRCLDGSIIKPTSFHSWN